MAERPRTANPRLVSLSLDSHQHPHQQPSGSSSAVKGGAATGAASTEEGDISPLGTGRAIGEGSVLWSREDDVPQEDLVRPHTSNPRYEEKLVADTPRRDAATPGSGRLDSGRNETPSRNTESAETTSAVLWASEAKDIQPSMLARPSTSNPWLHRFLDTVPEVTTASTEDGRTAVILWSDKPLDDWHMLARPHASNLAYESNTAMVASPATADAKVTSEVLWSSEDACASNPQSPADGNGGEAALRATIAAQAGRIAELEAEVTALRHRLAAVGEIARARPSAGAYQASPPYAERPTSSMGRQPPGRDSSAVPATRAAQEPAKMHRVDERSGVEPSGTFEELPDEEQAVDEMVAAPAHDDVDATAEPDLPPIGRTQSRAGLPPSGVFDEVARTPTPDDAVATPDASTFAIPVADAVDARPGVQPSGCFAELADDSDHDAADATAAAAENVSASHVVADELRGRAGVQPSGTFEALPEATDAPETLRPTAPGQPHSSSTGRHARVDDTMTTRQEVAEDPDSGDDGAEAFFAQEQQQQKQQSGARGPSRFVTELRTKAQGGRPDSAHVRHVTVAGQPTRPQSAPVSRQQAAAARGALPMSFVGLTSQSVVSDNSIADAYNSLLGRGDELVTKAAFSRMYRARQADYGLVVTEASLDRRLRPYSAAGPQHLTLDEFAVLYLQLQRL